jgi:hypothetical protein
MEQLLTFTGIIVMLILALLINSALVFLATFVGGVAYHVIRGRKKGWSLPKEVKKSHSW